MTKKAKIITTIISVALAISVAFLCFYYYYLLPQQRRAEQQRVFKEYYNAKINLFENENKTLSDVDVAFIGDSLTDGYDLNTYYPQYKTTNRGIAGDTTFGVQKRLKVSLYDASPKVVVMLIGGNNLGTMLENYEDILSSIKTNLPLTHIVVLSLTAMGGSFASKNELAQQNNAQIQTLATQYGCNYIDIFTPLYNPEMGEIYAEYTTDSVHLTAKGYQVLTNAITPVLQTLI